MDQPWWKYHNDSSWSMIPCLGSGIESLRNKVALELCLSQGRVMDGDKPSVAWFDVRLWVSCCWKMTISSFRWFCVIAEIVSSMMEGGQEVRPD